jgi:hypothetical protein
MGIAQLPSRDIYWSQECKYNSAFLSKIMSRNQFNRILDAFHYEKTHEVNEEDRKKKNKDDPYWSVSVFSEISS